MWFEKQPPERIKMPILPFFKGETIVTKHIAHCFVRIEEKKTHNRISIKSFLHAAQMKKKTHKHSILFLCCCFRKREYVKRPERTSTSHI